MTDGWAGSLVIGAQSGSLGTMAQYDPGSLVQVAGEVVLGRDAGSQGRYDLHQGSLNVTGYWTNTWVMTAMAAIGMPSTTPAAWWWATPAAAPSPSMAAASRLTVH